MNCLVRGKLPAALGIWLICRTITLAETGNWYAHAWQTDEGLPDNAIFSLTQTPDGFLWVVTAGGLMRFDGAHFQEFSPKNILDMRNRFVRAITTDHRGRLWLGMDDGVVVCVDGDRARVFTAQNGLPAVWTRLLVADGEGAIWITYPASRNVMRIKDGQVRPFGEPEGLPLEEACRLVTDGKDQLWFSKNYELGVFRQGRFQSLVRIPEPASAIAAAHDGGVWISTVTRLLRFKEGGKLEERGLLPQKAVGQAVLLEDRDGAVWFSTAIANGLHRFDGSVFATVSVHHPTITSLMEDREGNLWVGTGGGGLNRLRPRTIELVDAERDRPSQSVRSVWEDNFGALWLATTDGLLFERKGDNQTQITALTNWPGGRVFCVGTDHKETAWIGTRDRGLYRFRDGQFKNWRAPEGLSGDSVRSLLVCSNDDVWIAADSPRKLQRLRGGELRAFDMPPDSRSIHAMAEDAAGNFWSGTADGYLLRVSGDVLSNETTNDLHRLLPIRSLHFTDDGSLWIGYAGYGVGRLKDGRYSRIASTRGLNDNFIFQIVSDERGWVWFGGRKGFFRVQFQQLEEALEKPVGQVRSIVFGSGEGLPSLEAGYDNYPSAIRGRDGCPRIVTRTGLAVIHPENIRDNPDPPRVLMERVKVDGQTKGLYDAPSPLRASEGNNVADLRFTAASFRLPPSHRKLQFDFTALSFTAPENVLFRHRLEGYDDDWIEDGTQRSAGYSRLPYGDYRFRVTACNNAGVWNEAGATVNFTVLPFVWQTWWFQVLVVAGFTLSVVAVVRYVSFRRLRWQLRLLEQQAALDKERTRIARDLHDDLGGSLTQVALMLDLVPNEAGPQKTGVPAQQCSTMVRQVIKSVDEIIWAINPRNDTVRYLVDYISQFAVEFLHAARIRCRVELPDHFPEKPVSPEARHNLFLVVKEALNNVARHARASEVWLRIATSEERINIRIEDNGRGFESAPDNASADGLRNMRQRMEEIGGHFLIESKSGLGTQVAFEYAWPRDTTSEPKL